PVFFKRGRFYPPHDMMSHQVRYDFFLLKSLGIPTELSYQTPLSLAPHPDDQISVVRKMKARGWDAGRATIGIHLGAAGGNKPVLPEIYAAYASELGRIRPDLQFVITGASQEERHFRDRFLAVFSGSLIDMVGVTTLREMVALVAKFDVFVGIDTGPAHIAAAVKTPQLLLMTSKRVIPFKWGPWLNRHIVLSGNRNCVITCHARQCPVWTCSDDMSVTAMADATLRLLSGEGYETFEAQQMHWFQVSMSILMIGDEHSLDVAQRLCDEWRGWGVRVKFVRADNPDLYSECLANDVRIIQNLSGKRRIRLFVMSQLLNRELSHPPMVCHGIPNVNSLGELVSYYRRRFEVRIF
ncbi:hypothetical protein EBR96_09345, partial [bacterium]|nr:hypothetical protein [bacterium]